jgi:hypothetical protein
MGGGIADELLIFGCVSASQGAAAAGGPRGWTEPAAAQARRQLRRNDGLARQCGPRRRVPAMGGGLMRR